MSREQVLVRIAVYIVIFLVGITMIFTVQGVWGVLLAAAVGIALGAMSQWFIEWVDKLL